MTKSTLRCAIYTRKSSDEGLDQAFNSLQAQREACEAYISSQMGEGWVALAERYDDGGFSGGKMQRPALQRLMTDVSARKVDVVVVYKVDRLTRFLPDFARIVEPFDKSDVSFVSVTQAFNTTSSMGRLTLNMLLSFAQFEREITSERIRDKIAASKAKGMWMGGLAPLGYNLPNDKTRTLRVNIREAAQVRLMFAKFLELGSLPALQRWLKQEGLRSKRRVFADGRISGDCAFGRGALRHVMSNRIYLGQIVHKGIVHPGGPSLGGRRDLRRGPSDHRGGQASAAAAERQDADGRAGVRCRWAADAVDLHHGQGAKAVPLLRFDAPSRWSTAHGRCDPQGADLCDRRPGERVDATAAPAGGGQTNRCQVLSAGSKFTPRRHILSFASAPCLEF